MKTKFLLAAIITSILVLGVFGFASMNHGANHIVGCTASVVDNTPCPENIVAMSVHHIQTFVSFISVVPSIPFIFLIALLFSVFLGVGFLSVKHQSLLLNNMVFWRVLRDPERRPSRPQKITRWLSLFENSPSLHRVFSTNFNLMNLCKQKKLRAEKTTNLLIQKWRLILSAEWSLMRTTVKQMQIIRVKPITFVLSIARITLQPIL